MKRDTHGWKVSKFGPTEGTMMLGTEHIHTMMKAPKAKGMSTTVHARFVQCIQAYTARNVIDSDGQWSNRRRRRGGR
jgi:hypothetical protein